jgi:uncharacterized phage protein (TIGR01671 family)
MREIKFRAWDKELKEFSNWTNRDPMFDVSSGDFFFWERTKNEDGTYGGDIIMRSDWGKRFVLQQYTGLKDKNGIEIYDGDIINYTYYKGKKSDNHNVYWGKYSDNEYVDSLECWMIDNSPLSSVINDAGFGCSHFMCIDKNSVQVIGNIYENSEMVK